MARCFLASNHITARPRKRSRRIFGFELLEPRRLNNVDWRNPLDAMDVSGDRFISPIDALLVINAVNAGQMGRLAEMRPSSSPFIDVNGDQELTPDDALQV